MASPVLSTGSTANSTALEAAIVETFLIVTLLRIASGEAETTVLMTTPVVAEMGTGVGVGLLVLSVSSVLYSFARACSAVRSREIATCCMMPELSVPLVDDSTHRRLSLLAVTARFHARGTSPVFEKNRFVTPIASL
jgi:hypothetical protein